MNQQHEVSNQDAAAVETLREYLRIPSVHPNVNYDDCVSFLQRQGAALGLPVQVVEPVPGKPSVIITWLGLKPSLPSVLLNSHMDVVSVYPDKWTYEPFGAHMDSQGNIFARGAQDMKGVGMQHLEAVRRLLASGVRLQRTVHLSFVPDEETGGVDGMASLVHTEEFRKLNVGVAFDESMPLPIDQFVVFYGEKSIWQIKVHCPGTPGHGSLVTNGTAGEKLRIILDRFFDFRQSQKTLLDADPNLTPGDVTSVNLTMLQGGVLHNVLPPELEIVLDMRLAPSVDHKEFEATLLQWCEEAGPGTHIEFLQKGVKEAVTSLENNPWWEAFTGVVNSMKLKIRPVICPGGTDSRFLRRIGIPAFGFSPLSNTPMLLHDHDEFINKDVFIKGIVIIQKVIEAVANVPP